MGCELINFPGGGSSIICGPRLRRKPCFYCGKPAPWLCDFPVGGKDCDRPICADHRSQRGTEIDWCLCHVEERLAEDARQDKAAEEVYQAAIADPPPIQLDLGF